MKRDQIFISYSHRDSEWLEKLTTVIRPLIRNQAMDSWADTRIQVGQKWRDEISQSLAKSRVAVLLVSQHFLASDFIADVEMPLIITAAHSGDLTVVWIPITSCLFDETEIATFQAAHDPKRPLDSLSSAELNKALTDIARLIRDALNPHVARHQMMVWRARLNQDCKLSERSLNPCHTSRC